MNLQFNEKGQAVPEKTVSITGEAFRVKTGTEIYWLANAYPKTPLILWHWGSVDAPEWKEFNGNPEELRGGVANPERVIALNPGEAYHLTRLEK